MEEASSVNIRASVPPSKDSRQDKPKQLIRQPLEGEILVPEISFEQASQLCQEESLLLSSPPEEESPPPSRNKREHPLSTNPNQLSALSSQPQPLPLFPPPGFHGKDEKACQCWTQPHTPSKSALKHPSPKRHRAPPPRSL